MYIVVFLVLSIASLHNYRILCYIALNLSIPCSNPRPGLTTNLWISRNISENGKEIQHGSRLLDFRVSYCCILHYYYAYSNMWQGVVFTPVMRVCVCVCVCVCVNE